MIAPPSMRYVLLYIMQLLILLYLIAFLSILCYNVRDAYCTHINSRTYFKPVPRQLRVPLVVLVSA